MVEIVGMSTLLLVCALLTFVGCALLYICMFYWDCPATTKDRILTAVGGAIVLFVDWIILQDILTFVGWL